MYGPPLRDDRFICHPGVILNDSNYVLFPVYCLPLCSQGLSIRETQCCRRCRRCITLHCTAVELHICLWERSAAENRAASDELSVFWIGNVTYDGG